MKTFDKKDVYSWSNAEEAKTHIGKTGYFNNDFESIKRAIELGGPAVLDRVDTNSIWCFKALGVSLCFGLFLPADKVKEVEEPKKWRAFKDFNEFKILTNKSIGSVIVYKDKLTNDELEAVITRSKLYENFVEIGAVQYTFKELFDQWEWLDKDGHWQPFGVEE